MQKQRSGLPSISITFPEKRPATQIAFLIAITYHRASGYLFSDRHLELFTLPYASLLMSRRTLLEIGLFQRLLIAASLSGLVCVGVFLVAR